MYQHTSPDLHHQLPGLLPGLATSELSFGLGCLSVAVSQVPSFLRVHQVSVLQPFGSPRQNLRGAAESSLRSHSHPPHDRDVLTLPLNSYQIWPFPPSQWFRHHYLSPGQLLWPPHSCPDPAPIHTRPAQGWGCGGFLDHSHVLATFHVL